MIDAIRREVARRLAQLVVVDAGEVREINWAEQTARVRLASSGQLSGPLRIGAGAAWDQGGSASPLRVGDEVVCLFLDGKPGGAGFVVARLYGACALPSGLPENCFGWKQGTHKVLFGADGKVLLNVQELKVEAVGEASVQGATAELRGTNSVSVTSSGQASVDGLQVVLGGGVSGAVKFEELAAALTPWTTAVQVAFQALGVTLPVIVLAPARATKVTVG